MPCGKLEMNEASKVNINDLCNDIINDKFFGFVECDIKLPKKFLKKK